MSFQLRKDNLKIKTSFCPGCGYEIFINCFLRAIDELDVKLNEYTFVSGIGCAAWITNPVFKADSLHCLHGRALPFASGVKLANPALKVVVISGDGDLLDIGGNHLIHSALRNIDIPVFCLNNFNFGMTGGQAGSTTPRGAKTSTTPEGNPGQPMDVVKLLLASQAKLVSRYPLTYPHQTIAGIKKILTTEGCFRLMEIISPCPTRFGTKNDFLDSASMLLWQKQKYIPKSLAEKSEPQNIKGKIIFGDFSNLEEYLKLKKKTNE